MTQNKNQNVIIVGGGPAGMSCALWLKNYGLNPIIVERSDILGGLQALSPASNTWLLGWQATLGKDVGAQFAKHIGYERVQVLLRSHLSRATKMEDGNWSVVIARQTDGAESAVIVRQPDGAEIGQEIEITASAIVIACGTRFAGKDLIDSVDGARNLAGKIHIGPPSFLNPQAWFGPAPVVVGGGDNALECAYTLSRRGCRPTLVMRSEVSRASDKSMIEKVEAQVAAGNIIRRAKTSITRIEDMWINIDDNRSSKRLCVTIEVDENKEKSKKSIVGDSILLMLGYEVNTDSVQSALVNVRPAKLQSGHLVVNGDCETDVPGLYAIGDVANPTHPCVATAVAMGTMAARAINARLA